MVVERTHVIKDDTAGEGVVLFLEDFTSCIRGGDDDGGDLAMSYGH